MLAAQCNKLSSKSPPPLADAAVGKGFHPWKKSPTQQPQQHQQQQQSQSSQQQQQSGAAHRGGGVSPYASRPVATSAASACASAAAGYATAGADLYFPGAAQTVGDAGGVGVGKVADVYARHPYESWPFNAATQVGALKPADAWWDVHGAGGWLDVSGAAAHAQMAAAANYDYGTLSHTLAMPPTPFGLHHAAHAHAHAHHAAHHAGAAVAAAGAAPTSAAASLPPQVPSPRSQRRYTGRATCDCPNCQEAERLGPAGAHLRKKNIHSCHIPGCGKVSRLLSRLRPRGEIATSALIASLF